jgi:hypothetical protein
MNEATERDKNRPTRNYGKKDSVRVRKCTRHAKELRRNKNTEPLH